MYDVASVSVHPELIVEDVVCLAIGYHKLIIQARVLGQRFETL